MLTMQRRKEILRSSERQMAMLRKMNKAKARRSSVRETTKVPQLDQAEAATALGLRRARQRQALAPVEDEVNGLNGKVKHSYSVRLLLCYPVWINFPSKHLIPQRGLLRKAV